MTEQEIDARIGKTNTVLYELYRSMVTKRKLSNTVKLSVFISVFVPILTYDHESCVMTERILSQCKLLDTSTVKRLSHKIRNRKLSLQTSSWSFSATLQLPNEVGCSRFAVKQWKHIWSLQYNIFSMKSWFFHLFFFHFQ